MVHIFARYWALFCFAGTAGKPIQYFSQSYRSHREDFDARLLPESIVPINLQDTYDAYRILIVDDNQQIHDDYEKILIGEKSSSEFDEIENEFFDEQPEELGPPTVPMSLDHAYQGQEALELVKTAVSNGLSYDMAFVDMRMPPGWDGLRTIKECWKVDPELQVVICTAFSDKSWSDILNELGKTDNVLILKKPFDNAEVFQLAISLSCKRKLTRGLTNQLGISAQNLRKKSSDIRDLVFGLESIECSLTEVIGSLNSCINDSKVDELGDLHQTAGKVSTILDEVRSLRCQSKETMQSCQ